VEKRFLTQIAFFWEGISEGSVKNIPPPLEAKLNFLYCHFNQFCFAKSVEMAIQKEFYLVAGAAK
jgi:hypothetical protein